MFAKGEKTMFPTGFRCLPDRDNYGDEDIYGEVVDNIS
jgi:hypothetical protein